MIRSLRRVGRSNRSPLRARRAARWAHLGVYVGLIAFGAGCGLFKKPATPAEQARAALDTEGKKGAWIGHLDGTLLPVDGKEFAFTWVGGVGAKFIGLLDGQLCFSLQWDSQLINVTAKQFGEASLEEVRKNSFLFDARDALDYSAQAPWPTLPANHTQLVELAENRPYDLHRTRDDGTVATYHQLVTRIEICGPAPKFGPATKFITLTAFGADAKKSVPSLYIWQIDGSIDSSLVTGAAPAATPTPTDGDDSSSSAPARPRRSRDKATDPKPPSDDLMTTIAKDGRFTMFLKLLAASDYADKLGEGKGTYTVFLPTDDALAKSRADKWLKDPKTLNRAVHSHIFGGPKTRAQIVDDASVKEGYMSMQNENGDYIRVTVDNGTIHVGKKAAVVDPELTTSNGVIYVIDSSLY